MEGTFSRTATLQQKIRKLFTKMTRLHIGPTRNLQKSTSYKNFSMRYKNFSMSFAQKSAPLAIPVFIGVSEG